MKLFVDDYRKADPGMTTARTFDRAIICLDILPLTFLSLDYDLGTEKNGLDIVRYIIEKDIYIPHINVHSDHEKSREMVKLLEENNPHNSIITRMCKKQ